MTIDEQIEQFSFNWNNIAASPKPNWMQIEIRCENPASALTVTFDFKIDDARKALGALIMRLWQSSRCYTIVTRRP